MLLEGTQGAQSGAVDERDLGKLRQDRAAPRAAQRPQPHQQFVGGGEVRRAITVDEAFGLLRFYARNHNQHLSDLARQIAEGSSTAAELLSTP